MSRSYRKSKVMTIEPMVKGERKAYSKAERRSIKTQLATGVEDPFYFKATWHSDTVIKASLFGDEDTSWWTRK